MAEYLELDKTTTAHLTAQGEMCNRLARGTRIITVKRKEDWVKITWRRGKKKAGFFPRILVFKSPEFQFTSLAIIFSGVLWQIQMLKISMMKNC